MAFSWNDNDDVSINCMMIFLTLSTLPLDGRTTSPTVGSLEATVVLGITNGFSAVSTTAGGGSCRAILISFSTDDFSGKWTTSGGSFRAVFSEMLHTTMNNFFWKNKNK